MNLKTHQVFLKMLFKSFNMNYAINPVTDNVLETLL